VSDYFAVGVIAYELMFGKVGLKGNVEAVSREVEEGDQGSDIVETGGDTEDADTGALVVGIGGFYKPADTEKAGKSAGL
jgi:hypothetical protein